MGEARKKKRGVTWWLLLLQGVAQAGAIWLLAAEWAPLNAGESPLRLIGGAFLYMLLTWACAFGMTLWTYVVISLDDLFDLAIAALRASVYATWFVPAMLLVMPPAVPVVVALGIVIMVNAARLVVANPPPQRRLLSRRALKAGHRLFGESAVKRGFLSKDTSPALLGAFCLQLGSFAVWAGYPQPAAGLMAGGIASWTWTSIARGAYRPRRRRHPIHTVASVSIAVLLSISLSVVRQVEPAPLPGAAPPEGLLAATRHEVRQLVNPPPAAAVAQQPRPPAMPLVSPPIEVDKLGSGGIPGLILLPAKKRPQSVTIPPAYRYQVTLSPTKPVSIPFTGEYRLFRESSVQLPPGSEQRGGTPLDAVYVTTNGGPMETDAYQEFDPPVDFSRCGRIRLTLTSGEVFPASATLILVGTEADNAGEIGPEIFGMSGAREESLEFALPPSPGLKLKGIRIVFRHNPLAASHSTQVAVQRFTFYPRVL